MSAIKNRSYYDSDFKANAASLCVIEGKTLSEVSGHLGVPKSTLATWAANFKKHGPNGFKPKELSSQELENIKLKKELADARMERDILKKALAIFSKKT